MQSKLIEAASNDLDGSYRSTWILLTNSKVFFNNPAIIAADDSVPTTPRLRAWTDDYSSLLPILQLTHH